LTSALLPGAPVEVAGAPNIPGLSFRRYRDGDVRALAALQGAVEIADATYEILGEVALANELANLADFEPSRDLLLAEVDGRLVAASRQVRMIRDDEREFSTSGWVHPDWRRRGLGRAMLRFAEAQLRDRAAAEEAAGETRAAHLGSWSFDQAVGAVALLESEGYRPVRWFFEMVRPLDEAMPDRRLPDGIELRPVTDDLARAVLAADAEAFQDHWGAHETTEEDVRRMLGDPDNDLSLWIAAWAGDDVVGSVINRIYPTDNAASGIRRGWLDRVSVRRPWRRIGVASALIVASLRELRERDVEIAALGVDSDNPTGALGVYERLGFRPDKRSAAYRKPL
jgi:mycothiol synthase